MSFIYNMADTWNAVGTTFNGIYMNISNGAGGAPVGAAASRAFRIDANSAAIYAADISGNFGVLAGLVVGNIDLAGSNIVINKKPGSDGVMIKRFDANTFFDWAGFSHSATSDGEIGFWSTTNFSSGARDVILVRDAANTLAQRNGVNAQTLRIYNTFTSSVNYEVFKIDWATTAGICIVGPDVAASGTLRPMMARFNLITVASLPAPATANRGSHMFVSDANLPIIFTTVSAGGAVVIPVFSNGANWICG